MYGHIRCTYMDMANPSLSCVQQYVGGGELCECECACACVLCACVFKCERENMDAWYFAI